MNKLDLRKTEIKHFASSLKWYQKSLLSLPLVFLVWVLIFSIVESIGFTGDARYEHTHIGRFAIFQHDAGRNHEFHSKLSRDCTI